MHDGFIGDIGDYGKYDLLRVLNREDAFRLGVVWMKTKTMAHPQGKLTDYLSTPVRGNESLADCDLELYRILKCLVDGGRRTIADLQASDALPECTMYFDNLLDVGSMPGFGEKARHHRLISRKEWFSGALIALRATELVFFDPDNGLQTRSKRRHRADGPRYVWYDELKPFFCRGKSLIEYQHGNREKGGVDAGNRRRACELRNALKCERVWAM